MPKKRVLIVEDTALMRESLTEALERTGYEVAAFESGAPALEEFHRRPYHAVLTDLKLPGMDGIQVLKSVLSLDDQVPVVVITAHGTIRSAVEAMREGAFDYLTKPFQLDQLEIVLERALQHHQLRRENARLRARLPAEAELQPVGLESAAMQQLMAQVARIAPSDATVMLSGESGTGKEVFARWIHRSSHRRDRPYLCVNCAALSAGLLESELFGHVKGAFTGADHPRPGRFELADTGTLLLDEVSELDLNLQAKLLRVLQEKMFERVGSSDSRRVDVRIIATTNCDLAKAVSEGKFREDLYFRLNVVPLKLAPLRERVEDLEVLCLHFLERLRPSLQAPAKALAPGALALLQAYPWPGNVRELGNILERACLLCSSEVIQAADIRPWLQEEREALGPAGGALVGQTLEEHEKRIIQENLRHFGGNRQKTARALGIAERTLRDKIRRWELGGQK